MRTLNVALPERSYPIYIGQSLLERGDLLRPFVARKAVVISNEIVAPLYMQTLLHSLRNVGIETETIVLPDGEIHKNWQTLNQIFDGLLRINSERKTPLIALGGGVIGDMVGFAAATYQRGVPFIQIPTTLLSQVDSSVGGKTAINHPLGKNMIGAFYQPKIVVTDILTLNTLEDRELRAGMAEVVKYGLIRDYPFLEWLEENVERLLRRESDALVEAIERSCRNKAEVVLADETEQGERAFLNLGHTFGHAIETGVGYGQWLHGEAVAVGMRMAAVLSARLGWLTDVDVDRITRLLQRIGLPVIGPDLAPEYYLELMQRDKKVSSGKIRFVLLRALGEACISDQTSREDVVASIRACS